MNSASLETKLPLFSRLELMKREIRRCTPEHQLQYTPETWILRHPELLNRAIVVLQNYMAVAIDCPGYTSWMTNKELAPLATTFFDEYTTRLITMASEFGLTSLNSAGDEILFTGPKQHELRNVAFGLGAQAIFMEVLKDYPPLKKTVELHKGRTPALIHAGFVHPRDPLENLTLGLVNLGNDGENDFTAFYNGGDAILAKHVASSGFIGTTTGNLRLGGTANEGWGTGKYGPPIIFRERLDQETRDRLTQDVGVAVSTDISAEPATLNMPYTAIDILNLTLDPEQVLEILERAERIAPPAIIPHDVEPSYPEDFTDRTRRLAYSMSPVFQRGETTRTQPDRLQEMVNKGLDTVIFASVNWDHFHERLRRTKEALLTNGNSYSDDHVKTAVAKMIGAGTRCVAEAVSQSITRAGLLPKEIEATVHHDAYLIHMDNVFAANGIFPGGFGKAKMDAILQGAASLKSQDFRTKFIEETSEQAEQEGLEVNRDLLNRLIEETNFHTHVGIASGKGAIIDEPKSRRHEGIQMLNVRGADIPVASRLMGTLAKQAYRGQLRELHKIAVVDPESLTPDQQSQLDVLKRLKSREQDDAIIMETEQAKQLFDLKQVSHESLPNFPLKGVKKPVNMTIVFPSGLNRR